VSDAEIVTHHAASAKWRLLLPGLLVPAVWSAIFGNTETTLPPLIVPENQPGLVFETYYYHSPLEAPSQPVVSKEFYFRNEGSESVQITDLVPSCGCLKPTASAPEIAPGEIGRITIPVRTANEPSGTREYLVTVRYLDPSPREATLTWKVVLPEKKLLIEPRVLMVIGDVAGADSHEVFVSDFRSSHQENPLQIYRVESAPDFINAEAAGQTSTATMSRTGLKVGFSAEMPAGQPRGMITLFTNDPEYPALQIPVIAGRPLKAEDSVVDVSPELPRIVVRDDQPDQSQGTDVVVTAPADWTLTTVDVWPKQLHTEVSQLPESDAATANQRTMSIRVDSLERPDAGVEQGIIRVLWSTPEGNRSVSFPISIVRI